MQLQDMFKFSSNNEQDWLLRTLFAGTKKMSISTNDLQDIIPEIPNNHRHKALEIKADLKDPKVKFLEKRSGNIEMTMPVQFEFLVQVQEEAQLSVLTFSTQVEL